MIVICSVLIVFAVATPFLNTLFRLPRNEEKPGDNPSASLPPLSIVIVASNNAPELRTNLPKIFEQDYPSGYEVIVVIDKKEDSTEEVLKHFMSVYSNLYTTFIPGSSRYISRRKLAVTVGVKAAKHEWIVMTDASCAPTTDKWLAAMASHCTEDVDLVLGYSLYDKEASRLHLFERMSRELYILREAQRRAAYRSEGNNIMFRKSLFINGRGYEGNLRYSIGEYDFLVNKYSTIGNTVVELSPEAWITEIPGGDKQWTGKRVCYIETRRHLDRTFRHYLPATIDKAAALLNSILIITAIIVSACLSQWIMLAAALSAMVITIVLRTLIGSKAVAKYCPAIAAWRIVPLEIGMVLANMGHSIKHGRADKSDFICHKV